MSIDTAAAYGNEKAVGAALAESGIPRKDLFITTKLWAQDASYDGAKKAFEASLKNLGLDYLDLYLIHQPFGGVYGAWRAMEELNKEGRARAIGVSNPAVDQIETHPFCQQVEMAKFLKENKVQIESWSPFAEWRNGLFANETLRAIAGKIGKSAAQVVLRWLIQRGVVAIPKSVHPERIAENFRFFDFELSEEDMKLIAALDQRKSSFFDHRDPEIVKMIGSRKLKEEYPQGRSRRTDTNR